MHTYEQNNNLAYATSVLKTVTVRKSNEMK